MRCFELFENVIYLNEAREIFDLRHNNGSGIPYWGATKQSYYISPNDGFHWIYYDGYLILHSTDNEIYDYYASKYDKQSYEKYKKKDKIPSIITSAFNQLSGIVNYNEKSIKIKKEDAGGQKRQRAIHDKETFKKALNELKKNTYVDDTFSLKGKPADIPKNVGKALQMSDPKHDIINKNREQITMYHGTSEERWKNIQQKGLRPGMTGEVYIDLIPNYSEHNVYLSTTQKAAEFYAKRQASKDDSKPVILEVKVPDISKLRSDDRFVNKMSDEPIEYGKNVENIKRSLKVTGEISYQGFVPPKHISRIK